MAFLKEEYKWLSVFVVLLGGILCALFSVEDQHTKLDGVLTTFAFFLGAILSASAGWLGMWSPRTATRARRRPAPGKK